MSYILFMFLFMFILGLVSLASNPSPYFGAFGLVVAAGAGGGVLVAHGGSFLSLVLFLIYLGGMLVVFAYSAALASERYPEGRGSRAVMIQGLSLVMLLILAGSIFLSGWYDITRIVFEDGDGFECAVADEEGVSLVYSFGRGALGVSASTLLLTLFNVLELVRGLGLGALRLM
uniref:NADH-ubiquinone oxidoreductase chain 6 n=1 Tax=Zebrias quagga TaxID=367194 RepID=V9IMZ1_ZEBQU|nr:NADH dehydrogenase subunit 6 [Zebrias quagga]AFB71232.1 NADH dehydrogenase subunit 6 [Zebrias quagga]